MQVHSFREGKGQSASTVLLAGCVAVLVALFWPHLPLLYALWMDERNDSYSHGILIPLVVLYLVWTKRQELGAIPPAVSRKGGVALFLSSLFWLLAVAGSSRWAIEMAMVSLFICLVWFNWGGRTIRALAFPLSLLFLMIPLPTSVYGKLSFKLQLLSSRMAVDFMQIVSIPVLREGNVIHLPGSSLQVAEACSGISSLISLFTLALILAYISLEGLWPRVVITLSSFPIAVFMNWVRIAATGVLTYYWSEKIAQGFYHAFSGWLVFVVAFGLLVAEASMLGRMLGRYAPTTSSDT